MMDIMKEKALILAMMAGVTIGLYGFAELVVNKLLA
jgi:hypothetical protein